MKDSYIDLLTFKLEYERGENKFIFLSFFRSQFMFEQLHEEGWDDVVEQEEFLMQDN